MFDSEEGFELWWQDAVAASARGELPTWSHEEIEQHPMFCADVPADISSSPGLVAMQNLIYDEPPETVAQNFKTNGNEALGRGLLADAVIFYTKGLEMETGVSGKLRAILFSNRAQCYLKLRKYPEAFSDSRKALFLDASSSKAAYRGAVASERLGLWKDGLLFVSRGLDLAATDEERTLFSHYKDIFTQNKKEAEISQSRISDSDRILTSLLVERNISLVKEVYSYPGNTAAKVQLSEDRKSLLFPILMLYDEFNQSDWMLQVQEDASILDIHDALFETTPEWLPAARLPVYANPTQLNFFLEFHNPMHGQSQHLVRLLDSTCSLESLVRGKTLNGFPVIHVLASDRKNDIDTLIHQHTLVQ